MGLNDARESSKQKQPDQNDVLLGRAANVFHHAGNRRYRHIIAMNLRNYKEAKSRLDKMVLIRQVTEEILDNGRVKFLRLDNKTSEWKEVPVRTAQDKVSHALRDGINKPIFSPLMMSVPDSVTAPINASSKKERRADAASSLGGGGSAGDRRDSLPTLVNPSGALNNELLRRLSGPHLPPPPEQQTDSNIPLNRLDNMNAASAASRAALMHNLFGERRASFPTQIPTATAATLPPTNMNDLRRLSAPSSYTPLANRLGAAAATQRLKSLTAASRIQPRHLASPSFANVTGSLRANAPPLRGFGDSSSKLNFGMGRGGSATAAATNPYISTLHSLKEMQHIEQTIHAQKLVARQQHVQRPQSDLHAAIIQGLHLEQEQQLKLDEARDKQQFLNTLVQQYRANNANRPELPADLVAATSRVAAARQKRSQSEESLVADV